MHYGSETMTESDPCWWCALDNVRGGCDVVCANACFSPEPCMLFADHFNTMDCTTKRFVSLLKLKDSAVNQRQAWDWGRNDNGLEWNDDNACIHLSLFIACVNLEPRDLNVVYLWHCDTTRMRQKRELLADPSINVEDSATSDESSSSLPLKLEKILRDKLLSVAKISILEATSLINPCYFQTWDDTIYLQQRYVMYDWDVWWSKAQHKPRRHAAIPSQLSDQQIFGA